MESVSEMQVMSSSAPEEKSETIDIEIEGLETVELEWYPRWEPMRWWYSGGRYILLLRQADGFEWHIWLSPDQMRAIHAEIDKVTKGDPPRTELVEWINRWWNYVEHIVTDEGDWHDPEKCCNAINSLQQCWDEWNLVVESDDSTDPFPEQYRLTLGLPEGSTYSDAVFHIRDRMKAAWVKTDEWQELEDRGLSSGSVRR